MYLRMAKFLNIELSNDTRMSIEEYSSTFNKSLRNIKYFGKSFITGKSNNSVGLAGSVISDMTLVGDLRDLSKEGSKFVVGKEYDKFTLGISALGLALSASQIFTVGSSSPLKIGVSIIKLAKKSGKLTKSFLNIISSKLSKAVNFQALKKIDFTSIQKLRASSAAFVKTINFSYIDKLFIKVNKLRNNTSSMDAVYLLKYVDNEKDLSKVVKLSKKFGKNTKGVIKVLGKRALKTGKIVVKYSILFIAELVSFIISFLLLIFMFISKRIIFKNSST